MMHGIHLRTFHEKLENEEKRKVKETNKIGESNLLV